MRHSPEWPGTCCVAQTGFELCLLSAGIIGICHHSWIKHKLLIFLMFATVLGCVRLNFMFSLPVPQGCLDIRSNVTLGISERMFWMKLTFKTTDWEQQMVFSNVSELYPISWREWKPVLQDPTMVFPSDFLPWFPLFFLKKKDNKRLTWGWANFPAWRPLYLPGDLCTCLVTFGVGLRLFLAQQLLLAYALNWDSGPKDFGFINLCD